jgi:hypothetical protein
MFWVVCLGSNTARGGQQGVQEGRLRVEIVDARSTLDGQRQIVVAARQDKGRLVLGLIPAGRHVEYRQERGFTVE